MLNADKRVEEIIPYEHDEGGAWIAERDGRDWLTESDCVLLKDLVARLPLKLPGRVHRALWYHERAARSYYADVRWTLIATGLEALIHTERQRSTFQFTERTERLAQLVGVPGYTRDIAAEFYDLRSGLAHGQGLRQMDAHTSQLYIFGEDVLRSVVRKAMLDDSFAITFETDMSIRKALPL